MKFALVNPQWSFIGSTYFGSQQPVFPLELFSAREFLRRAGHEVLLIDAFLRRMEPQEVRRELEEFSEDFLVMPTANSYLFWRCPQPELRVPQQWLRELQEGRSHRPTSVLIGPHGSVTPAATLRKTGADVVLRGEPDQTLPMLANTSRHMIPGCVWRDEQGRIQQASEALGVVDMKSVTRLDFSDYPVELHTHKHHIFTDVQGLGAELEFARGCPYSCTFCNKTLFRNKYREREVTEVLAEVDALMSRGVTYIYFIDEIFGVGRQVRTLLEELARRNLKIGFQTRIDLWNEESLDLLGRAGCISMECGIESITKEGRDELNKNCKYSTDRIRDLLVYAKGRIPWVQANLIKTEHDDPAAVLLFQEQLKSHGVWVSEPVPMFPFPGSPEYVTTFGAQPDDRAWERAHEFYLGLFADKGFSDIQEQQPVPLPELELAA